MSATVPRNLEDVAILRKCDTVVMFKSSNIFTHWIFVTLLVHVVVAIASTDNVLLQPYSLVQHSWWWKIDLQQQTPWNRIKNLKVSVKALSSMKRWSSLCVSKLSSASSVKAHSSDRHILRQRSKSFEAWTVPAWTPQHSHGYTLAGQ